MILRLVSGSVTPASFVRKRSVASMAQSQARLSRNPVALSRIRSSQDTVVDKDAGQPRSAWSRRSARSTRVAATAESTPRQCANARPSPTVCRTPATVASMKCCAVQVGLARADSSAKLRRISVLMSVTDLGMKLDRPHLALGASMRRPLGELAPGGSQPEARPLHRVRHPDGSFLGRP